MSTGRLILLARSVRKLTALIIKSSLSVQVKYPTVLVGITAETGLENICGKVIAKAHVFGSNVYFVRSQGVLFIARAGNDLSAIMGYLENNHAKPASTPSVPRHARSNSALRSVALVVASLDGGF